MTIEEHLRAFDRHLGNLSSQLQVEKTFDLGYRLAPKHGSYPKLGSKSLALTIFGLVHGNEVAGVAVLNRFLQLLEDGVVRLDFPLGLALGNRAAAMKNQRYLEADLNRCFARPTSELLEEKRADELETMLQDTRFLFDIHQASLPAPHPFFIFPFTKEGVALARCVGAGLPIVTHWGKPYSNIGCCSDEFVNKIGGTGITIELGQNGFDPYQIGAGLDVCLRTVAAVSRWLKGAELVAEAEVTIHKTPLYTWAEVLPYPVEGDVEVVPGWKNFDTIKAGDKIASVDGKDIVAPVSGKMLFLRYQPVAPQLRPFMELCRIMKEFPEHELPA